MNMPTALSSTKTNWNYAEIWDQFPVPARPTPSEIKLLESELKRRLAKNSRLKLLILGSTIEYRSLARHLGVKPYVADFSRANYEALTAFSREKFPGEHFIEINWLDIAADGTYDVIVGHRVMNVVKHTDLVRMFAVMHRALKPEGVYFCRGNVWLPKDKDRLAELVKAYAFKKRRPHPLFTYLEVALYFHSADRRGYVNYPLARRLAKEWLKDGRISRADYERTTPLISMPKGTKFRGLIRREEIVAAYTAAGFKQVSWLFTREDYCRNMPIIKLSK
ncbi:MAG: hypothetical protein UY92_C0001G0028 [Candidatus Magasanikbacteria bacterium GW2011_GWA2_56_11]|uniref:Methyltransferase type 11 domain-containing protein n=1 Tax=Candidatus Magasanikbacteria bacterium GW2011_GWA2_56_11 TaxID=1619044 RepID=A0A0G2BBR8_9BACT|nr:MAG: hypothetical protein UY92_C0001G0028 [Candidatus Magasanikbacteria bacterium GW2011_GWA2_56_11]